MYKVHDVDIEMKSGNGNYLDALNDVLENAKKCVGVSIDIVCWYKIREIIGKLKADFYEKKGN